MVTQGTRFRQVQAARSRNTLHPMCLFVLILDALGVVLFEGGPCPPLYTREGRVTSPSPSQVQLQSSTRYGLSSFHIHTRLVRVGYAYPLDLIMSEYVP